MIENLTFDKICQKLTERENFTFSRIASDGELNCIYGKSGSNCDQHPYTPEMGARLKDIINKPQRYHLGLQSLAYGQRKAQIDEIAERVGIRWANADIMHHASIKGEFEQFFKALEGRSVIFVAPKRHSQLQKKIESLQKCEKINYVFIPEINCYSDYPNTKSYLSKITKENDVVLYSASMMTKVLIDDMFEKMGNTITQIDCGSVFEPYLGIANRTYHKKILERLSP